MLCGNMNDIRVHGKKGAPLFVRPGSEFWMQDDAGQ